MAKITVRYKCSDLVTIKHEPPTRGIITAVTVRGRARLYEISYTGDSGPTSVSCEEAELEPTTIKPFGFSRKDSYGHA